MKNTQIQVPLLTLKTFVPCYLLYSDSQGLCDPAPALLSSYFCVISYHLTSCSSDYMLSSLLFLARHISKLNFQHSIWDHLHLMMASLTTPRLIQCILWISMLDLYVRVLLNFLLIIYLLLKFRIF